MRVTVLVERYVHSSYVGNRLELVFAHYLSFDTVLLLSPDLLDFIHILEYLGVASQIEGAFHLIIL